MNNYRVKIKANPYAEAEVNDLLNIIGCSIEERKKGVIDEEKRVAHGGLIYFVYATNQEDIAISVYAKAKRNLDPNKYMVTLELPKEERKPRHLGSC